MHDEEGEGTKHQFVSLSTSMEYKLLFGHGKHRAWYEPPLIPLRFHESSHMYVRQPWTILAANELKSMLAHVVISYDVRLSWKITRPGQRDCALGFVCHPTLLQISCSEEGPIELLAMDLTTTFLYCKFIALHACFSV